MYNVTYDEDESHRELRKSLLPKNNSDIVAPIDHVAQYGSTVTLSAPRKVTLTADHHQDDIKALLAKSAGPAKNTKETALKNKVTAVVTSLSFDDVSSESGFVSKHRKRVISDDFNDGFYSDDSTLEWSRRTVIKPTKRVVSKHKTFQTTSAKPISQLLSHRLKKVRPGIKRTRTLVSSQASLEFQDAIEDDQPPFSSQTSCLDGFETDLTPHVDTPPKKRSSAFLSDLVQASMTGSIAVESVTDILTSDSQVSPAKRAWVPNPKIRSLGKIVRSSRSSLCHTLSEMKRWKAMQGDDIALEPSSDPWKLPFVDVCVSSCVIDGHIMILEGTFLGVCNVVNQVETKRLEVKPNDFVSLLVARKGWELSGHSKSVGYRQIYQKVAQTLSSLNHLEGKAELVGSTVRMRWPWHYFDGSSFVPLGLVQRLPSSEVHPNSEVRSYSEIITPRENKMEPPVPIKVDSASEVDIFEPSQMHHVSNVHQLEIRVECGVVRDVLLDQNKIQSLVSLSSVPGSVYSSVLASRGTGVARQYIEIQIPCQFVNQFIELIADSTGSTFILQDVQFSSFKSAKKDLSFCRITSDSQLTGRSICWNVYVEQRDALGMKQPFYPVVCMDDNSRVTISSRSLSSKPISKKRKNMIARMIHLFDSVLFVFDSTGSTRDPIRIRIEDPKLKSAIQSTCAKGSWVVLREILDEKEEFILDAVSMVEKVIFVDDIKSSYPGLEVIYKTDFVIQDQVVAVEWARLPGHLGCFGTVTGEAAHVVCDCNNVFLKTPLLQRLISCPSSIDKCSKVELKLLSALLPGYNEGLSMVLADGIIQGVGFALKSHDTFSNWEFNELDSPVSYTVGMAITVSRENPDK